MSSIAQTLTICYGIGRVLAEPRLLLSLRSWGSFLWRTLELVVFLRRGIEWLWVMALSSVSLRSQITDKLAWSFCLSGLFKVGSFRRCLEVRNGEQSDMFKILWKGLCPPKVELFSWQLCRGRVMVRSNLDRFGCAQGMDCPLCNGELEAVDHLFMRCPWSWNL
ncbi:hypothetical protein Dsin_000291 [Dipteronia sinensis]|uniref:Reverse transcriptase zinc-binding domain-containing protein n=1 Tax=Dipteronia sinensis TaxID=43782 RepID=A0AAE0B360_9ROSI|nr:hypothetical protein Dsin_000291 [Dipteronia sinensis]